MFQNAETCRPRSDLGRHFFADLNFDGFRGLQSRIEFFYLFIYLYIYIYVRYTVPFVTACGGWVLDKRLTKAITKVQKAARQK